MTKLIPALLLAPSLFGAEHLRYEAAPTSPPPSATVTVRLYNYANVKESTLSQAQAEAARILDASGIMTDWLRSPAGDGDGNQQQARRGPLGPTDLFLRVHTRSSNIARADSPNSMGYALVPEGASTPRIAGVMYQKVEDLLRLSRDTFSHDHQMTGGRLTAERSTSILLGHVIAHEIGHLLLGTSDHARRGLMQAGWNARTRAAALDHRLYFTDGESRQMREETRRRFGLLLLAAMQQRSPTVTNERRVSDPISHIGY